MAPTKSLRHFHLLNLKVICPLEGSFSSSLDLVCRKPQARSLCTRLLKHQLKASLNLKRRFGIADRLILLQEGYISSYDEDLRSLSPPSHLKELPERVAHLQLYPCTDITPIEPTSTSPPLDAP
ncbi:hypothetical protein ACLOJK_037532 [Asimina triloba]